MTWREKHEGFPGQRLVVVPRPILTAAIHTPLLKALMPSDAGFYPVANGHLCRRDRGCPESVFIYCARGRGWCELAGRTYPVKENQLLIIPSNTPHIYGADETEAWTIYWFHAVGSNVPFYIEKLGASLENPVVPLGGDVQLFSLFADLLQELERGSTLNHLIYAAHSLAHLMGLILRHKEEFHQGAPDSRERIARSIDYMKEHLREPLNVEKLASLVNLSRSHYTSLFQRITGYGPLRYLNHLRMQQAVQLLNTTNLPIKEISEQIGFADQLYFSRAFSKVHGHSPSEHRRRYSA